MPARAWGFKSPLRHHVLLSALPPIGDWMVPAERESAPTQASTSFGGTGFQRIPEWEIAIWSARGKWLRQLWQQVPSFAQSNVTTRVGKRPASPMGHVAEAVDKTSQL